MFAAILFITVTRQKQLECPSPDEWLNKVGHLRTTERHLATRSSEAGVHATTLMNLENIFLSARTPSQKST